MENSQEEPKNKISIGLVVSKSHLQENRLFPDETKREIPEAPYYLLVFISRERDVKMSCLPTDISDIKKILINLKEFSPNLVKGISKVMNQMQLSKDILHTTGLCYEMENCFYETYLLGEKLQGDFIEKLKQEFLSVPKILNVNIETINVLT